MSEPWERRIRASVPLGRVLAGPLFKFSVTGREYLPDGPYVAGINHLSHVDAAFAAMALRKPVRFMAAADLIGINRGLDFILPFYGAILVPRSSVPLGAMRTGLDHLSAGGRLGLFPEGRRTEGWRASELKRGAAWLSIRAGVPLVPVALSGTDQVMGLEERKVKRARVEVRIGKPLERFVDSFALTEAWGHVMDGLLSRDDLNSEPLPGESRKLVSGAEEGI